MLQKLLKDGTVVQCKIKRANNQSYDGYRLAQNNGSESERLDELPDVHSVEIDFKPIPEADR